MKGVFVLMDGTTIMQLIGSYGFPIVACIVMAWFVYDTTTKHRQEVENLHSQHKEEMTEVTKALNNNTLALQRLCDKLEEDR